MKTCGDCAYCDEGKTYWDDRYICLKKEKKHIDKETIACEKEFCPKKNDNEFQQSGCYLTTLICLILGCNDKGYILEEMRKIREEYLKPNKKYHSLLKEYDQIGPIISLYISYDSNKFEIASYLLHNYIEKVLWNWQANKKEEAINCYIAMVNYLKIKYGLIGIEIDQNQIYDLNTLGKARIKK